MILPLLFLIRDNPLDPFNPRSTLAAHRIRKAYLALQNSHEFCYGV
jgi:hypothetical protein